MRTPEFAGAVFHEVLAKSALNKVPQGSSMPFSWTINPYRGCSHACVYCVSPDTLILCADGRQRPLHSLGVGDEVFGTARQGAYRRYVKTRILAKWGTRKTAYRVTLADGTSVIASGDHRFLTERGWKFVTNATVGQRPHLTFSNRLMGFGLGTVNAVPAPNEERFRRGYLTGMVRGDGMIFRRSYDDGIRVRRMVMFRLALADEEALLRAKVFFEQEGVELRERAFVAATPGRRAMNALQTGASCKVDRIEKLAYETHPEDVLWNAGFLSGIFDAEGSCSRGVLRISNKNTEVLALIMSAMTSLGFEYVLEPVRSSGVQSVRLLGGLPARQKFFQLTSPAITRKLEIEGTAVKSVADLRVHSIEELPGEHDLIDITTGTGDFIANGVISHNCFARGSHRYLDFDTGKDFDSQIVVKVNVAEVLGRELAKPSWQRETVALGTNTDPYQRAEGRYKLMPGIVDALARSHTPFSILTKGTLLRRDLPALATAAERVRVHLAMSIAVGDTDLQQSIEPGTPTTRARLDTIAAARDAGFEPDVFVMPVLPLLTDSQAHLNALLRDIREAGARSAQYGALHLRSHVKPWFFAWLEREYPELLPKYRKLYPGASSKATQAYRIDLAARIRPLIRRYGLEPKCGSGRSRDPYPPTGSSTAAAGQAAPVLDLFDSPSIETPGAPAPTLF